LTLEDFSGHADTGGQVYVGGDTTLLSYTIGAQIPQSYGERDDLVVGGKLVFKGGDVPNGNIIYGDESSYIDSSAVHSLNLFNEVYHHPNRFDFAGAFQCYNTRQDTYCGHHDTGHSFKELSQLHMISSSYNRYVEVFSVTCSELNEVSNIIFDNAQYPHTTMLINVRGDDDCRLNHVHNWDPAYLVWSFCDATELILTDNNDGAILAPNADVKSSGMVNGQIVVKSYEGDGQQNYLPFEGCLPGLPMNYSPA
jgi:choice-of-anchor A domain-containing protein